MNPYLNTRAITDPGRFFGRHHDLATAYQYVQSTQNLSIVADRRFGKTSMLNMLHHPAIRKKFALPESCLLLEPCFPLHHAQDPADFWNALADAASRVGTREDNWNPPLAGRFLPGQERLLGELSRLVSQGNQMSILFDESDTLFLRSSLSQDDFKFLRSIADGANAYRCSFVIFSRKSLPHISRKTESSPFFNVFSEHVLQNLDAAEASRLVREPSDAAGRPLAAHEKLLLSLAGRQPLFLQKACFLAFELVSRGMEPTEARLREPLYRSLVGHLEDWWTGFEPGLQQALDAFVRNKSIQVWEREIRELGHRGFIDEIHGSLSVSPPILADFIAMMHEPPKPPSQVRDSPVDPEIFRAAVAQLGRKLRTLTGRVLAEYLDGSQWNLERKYPTLHAWLSQVNYYENPERAIEQLSLTQLAAIFDAGWAIFMDYIGRSFGGEERPNRRWKAGIAQIVHVHDSLRSNAPISPADVATAYREVLILDEILSGGHDRD